MYNLIYLIVAHTKSDTPTSNTTPEQEVVELENCHRIRTQQEAVVPQAQHTLIICETWTRAVGGGYHSTPSSNARHKREERLWLSQHTLIIKWQVMAAHPFEHKKQIRGGGGGWRLPQHTLIECKTQIRDGSGCTLIQMRGRGGGCHSTPSSNVRRGQGVGVVLTQHALIKCKTRMSSGSGTDTLFWLLNLVMAQL